MQLGSPPPAHCRVEPDVALCAARLRAGDVLLAPTDSFFGLIALATHEEGVARVLAAKGEGRAGKAMPLVVADVRAAWDIALLPPWAVVLATLWPGPLTLALPARGSMPHGIAAADNTCGVRVPANDFLRALAREVGGPLTATSANISGQSPVASLSDVRLAKWDFLFAVKEKETSPSMPRASTVVTSAGDMEVRVVRPGPVQEEILLRALRGARMQSTTDAVWLGRARFAQPERQAGYRFNLDSLLLVDFVRPSPNGACVDLGAGVGIIGQLLLCANKAQTLISIERQTSLAALATQNAAHNGLAARARVYSVDLREPMDSDADLVVFNPPYYRVHAGRPNACRSKDEARRECHGTLEDFVDAAARWLGPTGRVCAIVPYERREELRDACARAGFVTLTTQAVLAFAGKPPRHFLLEAKKGVIACEHRLPAWVIHESDGSYREDVKALTQGDGRSFGSA